MMKKIFISYADDNMRYSLKRIGKQAKRLGIFDEIILYTPDLLPSYIKESPLMAYKRGGGYWAWKPAIIWETLQRSGDGDCVIYADAGCSLKKSGEWEKYWNGLSDHNTIVFQFGNEMPEWEPFGTTSTKIKHWTKQSTFRYFEGLLGKGYGDYNKIWGGFVLCKGKENGFIKRWLDITLLYPELIIDPLGKEIEEQSPSFACHRHDQSIITPLTRLYPLDVLILTETSETEHKKAAVIASRIRAKTYRVYVGLRLKYYLRRCLGDKLFDGVKHRLKK
jgi:hypothetical protein